MAERQGDLTRLCGLWENNTKAGEVYYSGNLGAARLLIFQNGRKGGDRDPDWIAYISPGKRQNDDGATAGGGGRSSSSLPDPGPSSGAPPDDLDEIPF